MNLTVVTSGADRIERCANKNKKHVDIIVPLYGDIAQINPLISALSDQKDFVNKVFVVASTRSCAVSNKINFSFQAIAPLLSRQEYHSKGLDIVLLGCRQRLFPGAARNIGVLHSDSRYVAFLDVNTIPCGDWLNNFSQISNDFSDALSMLGSTIYTYETYMQKIVIAASYGFMPLETLPGSIIYRGHLFSVGLFNPDWRAGEDVDFLLRFRSLFPDHAHSNAPNKYQLDADNLFYYFFKWLRNYSEAAPCHSLATQSQVLMFLVAAIAIMFAFNWNALIAGWNEGSILYFKNITKVTFVFLLTIYAFLRGLYLPLTKKSFARGRCSPVDSIVIICVSIGLDFAKAFALVFRNIRIYNFFFSCVS